MSGTKTSQLFKAMQDATSVESFAEFHGLWAALEQYIQNTEEIEDSLSTEEKKHLDGARRVQERMDGVMASLAEPR